ncbi:LysR family transcriptional regulator (plasmid) [Asticcacaulis sp. DW145]|nr:LysR family transcriptional regulator [Asticcacaulis sp. DW145]
MADSIQNRLDMAQNLSWDDLRLVLAIHREGTLSAAGKSLGLSQPTMGRRLEAAETAFGERLFQRTTRGLVATGLGLAVAGHARAMEDEVLALSRRLSGAQQALSGPIRVSSSEWFFNHVLMPVFEDFMAAHPQVVIEAVVDTRALDLDRREADLVFRFGGSPGGNAVQRKVTTIGYGLYASASYLNRHGLPEAGEGENHQLILMDEALGHLSDVMWVQRLLPLAQPAFRSNSRDLQAMAAAAGRGLAVLPTLIARPLGLVPVDLGEDAPGREVFAAYHADLKPMARLRALIDHVVQTVPSHL